MGDNLDNVFVPLDDYPELGMRVLEWALDHFDSDKTKIILTYFYGSFGSKEFTKEAQEKYLPRCAEKKFIAEILFPEATNVKDSIFELVNKHGMKKLVYWAFGWNIWKLSTWFDENPTICCKIWVVSEDNGELILVRDTPSHFDLDAELQKVPMEVEKSWNSLAKRMLLTKLELNTELLMEEHKKHFEKSLARSEQSQQELEEKLLLWTEAAEKLQLINDKKLIDMHESARKEKDANNLLFQENIQLKQRISRVTSDSKLANDDHQATLLTIKNRLDSLQSDYVKLQAERDDAVKKAENTKLQEAENIKLLEAETIRISRKVEEKIDLMNKQEEELRRTIENCKQSISDLKKEKLELESTNANQDEKHKKNMEEFHKIEKEEKDVLLSEIEKLNQRNSDLIMEKEQKIKELQEEIEQKLELESTKANEICHLRNEIELLNKNQIDKIELLEAETIRGTEEKLLLIGCRIDPAFSAEIEEATSELEKVRNTASEESKRREKVEKEMLGTYEKAMLTMSKVGRELKIRDEEHKKEMKELLQSEKDERQQEVEHLKEKNHLLTEEIEQLKIENQQSGKKLEDNLCKIQEANEHKETYEKRIADIELALKTVNEHMDSLQLHHSKLQEDRDKLEEERGHAIKEAEELRKEREDMGNRFHSNLSSDFTLQELEQATQNFSDSLKLGEGGFGCVYKGILRGMVVAIKKLNHDSIQGVAQFQQEVAILTRIRHPHLVTLLGSCSEASALVYEILPNGSLEDRLSCNNNTPPLTWQVRTRIIGEICLALIFLHSSKPYLVVHGDLDPQNILLDSNFVSKLGDFGISRLIKQPENHYVTPVQFTNNPAGKFAYTDPEYMSSGELTPKSDIYSLGIVILRLLTGQSPRNIVRRVDESIKNGSFRSMVDGTAGNWPFDRAIMLAEIGLKCASMSRSARPDLVTGIWAKIEPLMKDASIVLEENHIPHHFICPILQDVMKNPHIAADGFTYESEAIQLWLNSGHNTSPMTNLQLPHHDLIPNLVLRSAIQEWLQLHPQP